MVLSIFSSPGFCEKINVDLFVMSQCPHAAQVENVFYMLSQRLKDKMKLNLYFIASEDIKGNILSPQGPAEVEEDMRQLAILKFFPDKFWTYINSRNTDYTKPEWKAHAYMADIDARQLESLMDTKGKDLLRENIQKAASLGVNASPTIYINGKKYEGSRSFPSLFLKLAKESGDKQVSASLPRCFSDTDCMGSNSVGICRDPATAGARCEPLDVYLRIIDIKDKAYVHDQAYNAIKRSLPGLKVSFLDYRSDEARSIIEKVSAQTLPVYLISSSVEKIKDLNRAFSQIISAGQDKIKQGGREYYLVNNTRDAVRFYLKRERKPRHMDLFVMSKCPFGIKAEQVIYPIARKAGISLDIRYIANFRPNSGPASGKKAYALSSLHGQTEVEEDIRQLCARKYFPQKYFDYILDRNKDISNPHWEKAAVAMLGKDAEAAIKKCQSQEGEKLLEEDMGLAEELHINASPTILWENQRRFVSLAELKAGLKEFKGIDIEASGSCK